MSNQPTERRTYTYSEVRALAESLGLGQVTFRQKIAANTGNPITVAYVGNQELFAKATTGFGGGYYICNEFETMVGAK